MEKHIKHHYVKPTLWIVGVLVAGLIVINLPFLLSQIQYTINRPDPIGDKLVPPVNPGETGEPNTLLIESLGIIAPIKFVTEKTEKAYQTALLDGVVHYPDTADIGEVGNAYIFGHSSDYLWSPGKYKTVFTQLPRIEMGAGITVSNAEGKVFHYRVVEKFVVSPDDLSVVSQETNGKKILTLQTSYPIGTALKRFIVRAEIVE